MKVTLLQENDVVLERLLQPQTEHILTSVDESDLKWSHNVEVPGSLIRPGVRMVVELDPEGVVPLAPGSRVRYPEEGSAELPVVKPQLFRQIFVPTLWIRAPDHSVFDWLAGMDPDGWQMRFTRNLLPVSEMEVEVRDTFWTNADLRTAAGWSQWFGEIGVLHIQEGRRGYYYGVVGAGPAEWGGLAGRAVPWSVGLPDDRIYTHELGHNMNLGHAPCGGAWSPDPNYPYRRGSIGIWGYDTETGALVAPGEYSDIMGYCRVRFWISDYHFDRATTHRLTGDGGVDLEGGSEPDRGEMLVVWGSVRGGELALDPAFVLEGPVELPDTDGPYRVEGLGADGESMFSLSFTPTPRGGGGAGFAYCFLPARVGHDPRPDRAHRAGGAGHRDSRRRARDGGVDGSVHGKDSGHRQELGREPAPRRGDRGRDDQQGDPDGGVPNPAQAGAEGLASCPRNLLGYSGAEAVGTQHPEPGGRPQAVLARLHPGSSGRRRATGARPSCRVGRSMTGCVRRR